MESVVAAGSKTQEAPLSHVQLLGCEIDSVSSIANHYTVRVSLNKAVHAMAMLDSGSAGNFISPRLVEKHSLRTTPCERPLQVTDVQGGAVSLVTEQVVCQMDIGDHHEMVTLDIVPLGKHAVILGLPWLQQHKPTISWWNGQMSFPSLYCHEMGCSSGSVKLHQKPQKDASLQDPTLQPLSTSCGKVSKETLPISRTHVGIAPQREALPTSRRNILQEMLPTSRQGIPCEKRCEPMSGSQPMTQ